MKIKQNRNMVSVAMTFKGSRDCPHIIIVKSKDLTEIDKLVSEYIKSEIHKSLYPVIVSVHQHCTDTISK